MSVEEDIKKAVAGNAGRDARPPRIREEDFAKLRADLHGAINRAWAALVPSGEWLQVDDRYRDITDEWLKQKRG